MVCYTMYPCIHLQNLQIGHTNFRTCGMYTILDPVAAKAVNEGLITAEK